jgi:hypothetical protein
MMNDFSLYLLESGLSLALLFAIYWLFLRRETFFKFNRAFLLGSMALSLTLPLLDFSAQVHRFLPSWRASGPAGGLDAAGSGGVAAAIGWGDVLWTVYLLGVALLSVIFLYQLGRLFLLAKRCKRHHRDGFRLLVSDSITTPFSFFNLVFLNHKYLSEFNYRRIITHEVVHINQLHSLDLLVAELLIIFQWFNPFVWSYKKALKETHEFLADDGVLAQGFSAAKYQMLIYEQLMGVKLFELANNFNDSTIKRRLEMMTKAKSHYLAKLKVLACLPVLLGLVLAFTPPVQDVQASPVIAADDPISQNPQDKQKQKQKQKEFELQQKKTAEAKKKMKKLEYEVQQIDQKLADTTLAAKDRDMLLKKKQKYQESMIKIKNGLNGKNGKTKVVKKKKKDKTPPSN